MPTFEIKTPVGVNQLVMKGQSMKRSWRRRSSGSSGPIRRLAHREEQRQQPRTGRTGDPLGAVEGDDIEVRLILKAVAAKQEHPVLAPDGAPALGRADRNLEGVRKCILHAVWQAQGHGCSIGAVGVAIGVTARRGITTRSSNSSGPLTTSTRIPTSQSWKREIMRTANTLGLERWGSAGSHAHRLQGRRVPQAACQLLCLGRVRLLAFRRLGVIIDARTGEIKRWLYREDTPAMRMAKDQGSRSPGGRYASDPAGEARSGSSRSETSCS